ncbi:unnamed protein product [Euphydryas editha]|uniref:Uncharacterized protein n=1 Tax=Euphydryas editha TaxID=104508 RepID=A0AAU9UC91_EUPED|nr:unnamed protein product [Euphydryas editha]
MSQIVTRKGPVGEDKDKRQIDSPVKEMKKKIAANAEKEKQAAEKNAEKTAQNDKKTEKSTEKTAEKPAEKKDKLDKSIEKSAEKKDKAEKSTDKGPEKKDKSEKVTDKNAEKKDKADKIDKGGDKKESSDKKDTSTEKVTDKKASDKKDAPAEKASDSKEKNGKPEIPDEKTKKPDTKTKENGVNGEQNGDTVSSDEEIESDAEMFPELAYDDSDECFEPNTPEGVPSRSYTRRSQVKATRTPETPRPASEKNVDKDYVPDDSKLLKLKDDNLSTDRKLRSSDSPKPQDKKIEKVQESKKSESPKKDTLKPVQEEPSKPDEDKTEIEIEVEVAELESEESRRVKSDTNYSKSRVKVSPYRRSRLDRTDHSDVSLLANYTGNNTTMEMDITESFLTEDTPESPYLSGLRSIRARRSYRPLKEMTLRNISFNRSTRSTAGSTAAEHPSRPTGTVVGRKRRPEADESVESVEVGAEADSLLRGKRPRLLERLARPFRLVSTPLPARRNAEIVGINTDLPLTAPVAAADTFDPEAIKPIDDVTSVDTNIPNISNISNISNTPQPTIDKDSKRCIVM